MLTLIWTIRAILVSCNDLARIVVVESLGSEGVLCILMC